MQFCYLFANQAYRDAIIVELRTEIQKLKEDHDDLEQYGRRKNIRISGIPEPVLKADEVGHNTSSRGTRQRGPQGRPTPPTQRHRGEPQIEEAPKCQRWWPNADRCMFPIQ